MALNLEKIKCSHQRSISTAVTKEQIIEESGNRFCVQEHRAQLRAQQKVPYFQSCATASVISRKQTKQARLTFDITVNCSGTGVSRVSDNFELE